MIFIKDVPIPSKEIADEFIKEMMKYSYKEEYVDTTNIFKDLLYECLVADERLQEMVSSQIGEGYFSFVFIPTEETEYLDSFSFRLAAEEGLDIKKRDELKFQSLCDICFGSIKPYYSRIVEYCEGE